MAALRLQHEALQQKRDAVVALARHAARNAVKRRLQAEGAKVALVPYSVASKQGGQDRVRTLSAAARSSSHRRSAAYSCVVSTPSPMTSVP